MSTYTESELEWCIRKISYLRKQLKESDEHAKRLERIIDANVDWKETH